MMRYMIVGIAEGDPYSAFFNTLNEAEDFRMNIVCGLGASAQVYKLDEDMGIYEFLYE